MEPIHEQYVVDRQGRRAFAVVPMAEWKRILEALEELEDIRAYDEAKSRPSDAIPFSHAIAELREGDG